MTEEKEEEEGKRPATVYSSYSVDTKAGREMEIRDRGSSRDIVAYAGPWKIRSPSWS